MRRRQPASSARRCPEARGAYRGQSRRSTRLPWSWTPGGSLSTGADTRTRSRPSISLRHRPFLERPTLPIARHLARAEDLGSDTGSSVNFGARVDENSVAGGRVGDGGTSGGALTAVWRRPMKEQARDHSSATSRKRVGSAAAGARTPATSSAAGARSEAWRAGVAPTPRPCATREDLVGGPPRLWAGEPGFAAGIGGRGPSTADELTGAPRPSELVGLARPGRRREGSARVLVVEPASVEPRPSPRSALERTGPQIWLGVVTVIVATRTLALELNGQLHEDLWEMRDEGYRALRNDVTDLGERVTRPRSSSRVRDGPRRAAVERLL